MSDLNVSTTPAAPLLALETTPHYYHAGRFGLTGGEPGVSLQLLVGEDRLNIEARRGKSGDLIEKLRQVFGAAPVDKLQTVDVGGFDFVGISPARWHAISRGTKTSERRRILQDAVQEVATLVDVSHGFAVFRLSGPMASGVLSKLARIDSDPAVFTAGSSVTTELHGMTVQIRRTRDGGAYEFAVARSFGGSLFHALTHAAESFGLAVLPSADLRAQD